MGGNDYMDQEPFHKNMRQGPNRRGGKMDRGGRRFSDRRDDRNRKRPLLSIPMAERPHCKFYMEGKCMKVMS